jgi:hypothetical protein
VKLTAAQRRVLQLLAEGQEPTTGLVGMSAHGGFFRTWWSLVRAGLVVKNSENKPYHERITSAGRAALAEHP